MSAHRRLLPIVLPVVLAACATTGATLGSGVGDVYLERPPHYAGSAPSGGALAYLPVAYQRGASQAPIFDPSPDGELGVLLDEMTGYLESLRLGKAIDQAESRDAAVRVAPDVRFGCVTESGDPADECADRGDEALGRGYQPLKLAVGRPSRQWVQWIDSAVIGAGAEQVLVVTLEIGQYWIRQRGLAGKKEVVLGSDHVVSLPWLTSLETPVAVVQLTGALVGPGGKAIRIGAEGLMVRRTQLLVSAIGGQALVTDDDVRELRSARRDDRPGSPLVWKTALRTLVTGLTGRRLDEE